MRPPPRRPPRRERAGARGALRIRAARLADAGEIARVMSSSIRGLAAPFYGPAAVAAWSSLPALYHAWAMSAGGERYLVALRGGRIVGYAARRRAELTALFVRPREARRGVGLALLRRVEQGALRARLRRLRVLAALSAVAFYEAAGFRGRDPVRVPLPGGASLAARALAKPLRAPGARPPRAPRSSRRLAT